MGLYLEQIDKEIVEIKSVLKNFELNKHQPSEQTLQLLKERELLKEKEILRLSETEEFKQISKKYQRILKLKYERNLDISNIAGILKCSKKTIEKYISKTLKRLNEMDGNLKSKQI